MNDEIVYEIAYFRLHGGATTEDAEHAADKIQRGFDLVEVSDLVLYDLPGMTVALRTTCPGSER